MTNEPVAYAAVAADGSESIYVAALREQAEAACRENGWILVPLGTYPATWPGEVADVEAAFERSGVKPTWPDDEPGNIGPMAAAMADEIERLRGLVEKQNRIVCDTKTNTTPSEGTVQNKGSVTSGAGG